MGKGNRGETPTATLLQTEGEPLQKGGKSPGGEEAVKSDALQKKWREMSVQQWHDAMYRVRESNYFADLLPQTTEFIKRQAARIEGPIIAAEIGCGTGACTVPVAGVADVVLGIDFNADFIDFARREYGSEVDFLHGDCQVVGEVLEEAYPEKMKTHIPLLFSVNNTHGILPASIEANINAAMAEVCGEKGIIVIGLWNGNKFGDAVQHFYAKNPSLCGQISTGATFDWPNCTMTTADGYTTKWSTPEETLAKIEGLGWECIELLEAGAGVLIAARPARTN